VAIKRHGTLVAAGKTAEADAWSKKWIAENPKDVTMRLYLGGRELAAKNLRASAAHYQAVIGIEPNDTVALNNLAWIGGQLNDPNALDYAARAVRLEPNNASVLDTYGMLLVKKGDADKGLPFLERARKLDPARNELRLNYAKALIKAGKKDDARKELEALQAVEDDFSGKDEVAGLLRQL
jgi:tetratricopeptide (TPR) repeat protein